jgi:hypothetical protein
MTDIALLVIGTAILCFLAVGKRLEAREWIRTVTDFSNRRARK